MQIDIPHQDYWVVENYTCYKIKVVDHKVLDHIGGVVALIFHKFIDRFEISPLIIEKSVTMDAFPMVFHENKEDAMVILAKMFIRMEFIEEDGEHFCTRSNEKFDIQYVNDLIKHTTNEYPDKFI